VCTRFERQLVDAEHAGLGGYGELAYQCVEAGENRGCGFDGLARRVDADHRVAAAEQQPIEGGQDNPLEVVRRVIGVLSPEFPELWPHLRNGITPEVAAATAKLTGDKDLVTAAARCE
jgi:hypothetical protein